MPVLALGFAIGVERVAAYDMGYDSACDEIDLLEIQGGYTRAHLTRIASIYTTGRGKYTISYPNDPTALALPFNTERSIGGEDVVTSVLAIVSGPRAARFHRAAAQPVDVPGRADARPGRIDHHRGRRRRAGGRTIVNGTDLELRDAVLVDFPDPTAAPRDLPGHDRALGLRLRWPRVRRPPYRRSGRGA